MKIIILHGDDVQKIYNRLAQFINEAKKRNWEIVNDVVEETPSLFGHEKLIIIRKYSSLNEKDINLLDRIPGTLVIYNQGTIPAAFVKKLPKDLKVEKFDLSTKMWSFLDNPTVENFKVVLKTEPVELIFSLYCTRIRDLYWAKVGKPIYPSWRVNKLMLQAKKYTQEDLEDHINSLSEIDLKSKTTDSSLQYLLEISIIKLENKLKNAKSQ